MKKVLRVLGIGMVVSLFLCGIVFAQGVLDKSVFENAKVNWRQFEGQTINLLLCKHPMQATFEALIGEFESLTGIKVNVLALPEQQFFERQTIVLTGKSSEFDIVMSSPMLNWKFIPGGFLEPLNAYLEDPSLTDAAFYDIDDFFPMTINASKVAGKLYAIPYQVEAYTLYYRSDILDKYGTTPPETLDELYEVTKKIKAGFDADGITDILPFTCRGVKGAGTVNSAYLSLFSSYGGKDFDKEGNPSIYSETIVAMSDLWTKLIRDFGPKDWSALDWYDVKDAFASGKAAMIIDADHWGAELEDPAFSQITGKWKATHVPKGPAGIQSNIWAWSVAMNAASQNKRAAWLFLEWASSKPVMLVASLKYNNQTPVRNSVWNDPEIVERTNAWGQGTCRPIVTKNLEEYAALRWTPNPNAFALSETWQEQLQRIWSQDASADEAIKEVQKQSNALKTTQRLATIIPSKKGLKTLEPLF